MTDQTFKRQSRSTLRALAPMKTRGNPIIMTVGSIVTVATIYLTWGSVWSVLLAYSSSYYTKNTWVQLVFDSVSPWNLTVFMVAALPVVFVCFLLTYLIADFVTAPARKRAKEQVLEQEKIRARLN